MKKIGITGSIASGKTTASKFLSIRRGPLFSADKVVSKLYKNKNFKKVIIRKFNIKNNIDFKKLLKKKILQNNANIKKLERIIHPLVRKEMKKFALKNRNKNFIFFEIFLLIESKLMKFFDIIIFIKSKKIKRLKRFQLKGGEKKLFYILNNKQMPDEKKIKFCDYIVVNDGNLNILKRNLLDIINLYA